MTTDDLPELTGAQEHKRKGTAARKKFLDALTDYETFSEQRLGCDVWLPKEMIDAHRCFQTNAARCRRRLVQIVDGEFWHSLDNAKLPVVTVIDLMSGHQSVNKINGNLARQSMARRLSRLLPKSKEPLNE